MVNKGFLATRKTGFKKLSNNITLKKGKLAKQEVEWY